jgi:hypothetical protein
VIRRCAWCADRFEPHRWRVVCCSDKCRNQRRYDARREAAKESFRRYRRENKEAIAEQRRLHNLSNPEINSERCRRWREENKQAYKLYKQRHFQENKESYNERARRWRASNPEAAAAIGRRWRASNPEAATERSRRRNALKKGATIEIFTSDEVFERDGWICQLCFESIDRTAKAPHPMSVSLDHVIPLIFGGDHSRANTQCAHLICNVRKGARLPENEESAS